jgi:hypothetical protein
MSAKERFPNTSDPSLHAPRACRVHVPSVMQHGVPKPRDASSCRTFRKTSWPLAQTPNDLRGLRPEPAECSARLTNGDMVMTCGLFLFVVALVAPHPALSRRPPARSRIYCDHRQRQAASLQFGWPLALRVGVVSVAVGVAEQARIVSVSMCVP